MSFNFFKNHTHHYRSLNPYTQQRGFGHDLFDCMRNQSAAYVPRVWIRSTMMGKGKRRKPPLPAGQILSKLHRLYKKRKMSGGSLYLPGQRGGSLYLPGQHGGSRRRLRGSGFLEGLFSNPQAKNTVRGFPGNQHR